MKYNMRFYTQKWVRGGISRENGRPPGEARQDERCSRLYLKALEIQGFKSFPDKTVLTFGDDITAIVGPNGSGKSNISDAIRWVMGEQSTRALRGGKMEDVIFGGTLKRKQMGFAEVSLVLDNTAHIFDLEENEVMVTRRYFRSGESEYFINRRSCRLKDVNELFMDTGLGKEGYSIISQGKIDEILSVKSEDRRNIFEEAAGISRYRHRKEESQRKLQYTEENLLRINDKIGELELQVEPLRAQAEKAKKYLILRDELRGLEISVWLANLDRVRQGNVKLNADCAAAQSRKEAAAAQRDALYARAEELAGAMQAKDLAAEERRRAISELDAAAGERESAIAVLKSKIENSLENAQRIRQELDEQEGREDSIGAQMAEKKTRMAEILERRAGLAAELEQHQREAAENAASAGSLARELEALRQKAELETASAGDAKALLSALAGAAQELLDRETALRAGLQENQDRLAQARADAAAKRKELADQQEEQESLKNMISGYQMRTQSREKRLGAAQDKLVKLQMEENALFSRIHMLSEMEKMYEGYSKAVRAVMQEKERGGLKHIRGPVADLLRVPDRYTVAIETALGGAMQNIVVDRDEDGKAAIAYLKRRDIGRATFLPMGSVRPGELREKGVEREAGYVGVAAELVECDSAYRGVFSHLLGRVVVAEDLDAAVAIARRYGHRFRIVTLDGQVMNPGGSMTGGAVSRSAGILSRKSELDRITAQAAALKGDLTAAAQEREEAQRELTAAQYELDAVRAQQREREDAVLKLQGEVGQYDILLDGLSRGEESARKELEELAARSARTEADTAAARARIEELEGRAAALKAEAEGKAAGETAARERAKTIADAIAEVKMELAALEAELAASQKSYDELDRLHQGLAVDRQSRLAQAEAYQAQGAALTEEIRTQEQALAEIQSKKGEETLALQAVAEEKLQLEGQRTRADKESREKNEELMVLERECSFLEQKKAAAALEEKQLLDKLWDTYELSYTAAKEQQLELESVPAAARRIGELKKSISGLGNVNLGAVEEFERVNGRYTYLTGQRDDVDKARGELLDIITGITAQMETIFKEQFQAIREAFSQTFLELFGGGRAALELEDENDVLNCGIEIKVQPPGKALKIISLLSGGEKAFVAIALYFAILKIRPTPFVVMDEIEAALDDANVSRFARYMRSMADKTQFIVITHRRGTMEEADILYGVTMQEQGVSRMLTIDLNDVERELHIK